MKQEKGFTLIELLGVIGLIVIPSVTNLIKDSKQKIYDSQVIMIEKTAKSWAAANLDKLPEKNGTCLALEQLIQGDYDATIVKYNLKGEY
ncbi:MAG: prepilin-type N-terminal cleavage/methylation domain-containing protein [Bacilli bacterium]|nr:prepilin-type N-terminal cleavage/methylation domain-containing protein [Bacilli bacterium]MDD4808985.1 prepilin-type N-terminal cleavage/methylation domain-containing protein [Bacilli bacterium]